MDSLFVKERYIDGNLMYIAAVCDGVGSMEDGAFASSAAVRLLSDWFDRIEDTSRLGLRLQDCVVEINSKVLQEAAGRGLKTATTLSALVLDQEKYYIVHTGDSRIYSIKNGGLKLLTQDQVAGGKLTSCLGHREKMELFYDERPCAGESFLLCSDGLYKRMDEQFLCDEVSKIKRRNMRKSIENLVQYAIEQGERDNISLALLIYES